MMKLAAKEAESLCVVGNTNVRQEIAPRFCPLTLFNSNNLHISKKLLTFAQNNKMDKLCVGTEEKAI